MTETRRTIEGRWQCSQCDTQGILGRHRFCHACGSPREKGEMSFDFGATNADGSSTFETVQDADLLEAAQAGADWHCRHCDGGNRADWSHCTRCGANADGTQPAPPTPPPPVRRDPGPSLRGPLAMLTGTGGGLVALCTGICSALCGVSAWVNRDLEVTAVVAERTWTRQVDVERLRSREASGWRDRLPAAGHPPGHPGPLQAGLGEIHGCETVACWPRPPTGTATARVDGHRWERTITRRPMKRRSESGWRDQMPGAGRMPVSGRGGSTGSMDSRCRSKERTPERCRQVSKQVACGTERSCSIVDKGNGFAEEVCSTTTTYCTEYEEECTPAVRDDWCTWTQLSWGTDRTVRATGNDRSPRWPTAAPRSGERETRSARYLLDITVLAGRGTNEHATDEASWRAARVGRLVFTTSPVRELSPDLQVRGDRVDCDDGIPVGTIGTRETCRYTVWDWVEEEPRTAVGRGQTPAWPDGALGNDGRERRSEWVDVRLTWTRGDVAGERTLRLEPAASEAWPTGRELPVVVDADARFIRFPEEPGGSPEG